MIKWLKKKLSSDELKIAKATIDSQQMLLSTHRKVLIDYSNQINRYRMVLRTLVDNNRSLMRSIDDAVATYGEDWFDKLNIVELKKVMLAIFDEEDADNDDE